MRTTTANSMAHFIPVPAGCPCLVKDWVSTGLGEVVAGP